MQTKLTIAVGLFASVLVIEGFAQGTAFTYQGRLNNNGNPANGTYDLVFTIYDLPTGPGAFANQTNSAVAISNGLFTATLNLGVPGIFTGPERWLEIAVRTNGGGSYSNLVPRQKITATPYAITASNLSGTISSSQLSGTIPLSQLPAAVVTNNQSGVNVSGTFTGNGGSLTNLNSLNLAGPLTVAADLVSLGHSYDGGSAFGVAVAGNFAYLANFDDGLRVYNIANPANPVSIGHINDGGNAYGVAVSGNFAFLANFGDGLRVYNIANPTNPVSIGHINDGGVALGVAVSGNFAYLANQLDGLRVYNIANPTNPVSIGHSYDGGNADGVAVSGNFAYLANEGDGLRVYNIANPANPVSIGHINDGGGAFGVAVSGNFAYLANDNDGLRVYNIANPTNPVSIGHINDGGIALGVAVSGNFAYLANNNDGLRVYNIANPTNPVSIGHSYDGGLAWGVAVSGNFAYLANWGDGLRVYGLLAASASAFHGDGSLLTGLNANNITSGTLNAARIPNLDASKITTGTIADTRLSDNVALRAGGNAFTGNQTVTGGNVGIGTVTPTSGNGLLGTVLNVDSAGNANTVAVLGSGATSASGLGAIFEGRSNLGGGGDARLGQLGFLRGPDVTSGRISSFANLYVNNDGSLTEALHITPTGNVGIGTPAPANKLHVNGGITCTALTQTSDRNAKENFAPVSPREVLDKVAALPISTWNFKELHDGRHIGPMAQDFHAAFDVGMDDKHIATVDADGVALAAIQGLNQKLEDQRAENASLKSELDKLKQVVDKLANAKD